MPYKMMENGTSLTTRNRVLFSIFYKIQLTYYRNNVIL